jgi:serine/threonine-protein kinase
LLFINLALISLAVDYSSNSLVFFVQPNQGSAVTITCPKCHSENPETKQFCADCGTQLIPRSKDVHPEVTETLQTAIRELTTGSTFANRYQIIEELGKGGMGKVYKVFDTKIKEKIALKLIKPEIASDKETIERFSNELKLARKIRHKNVCGMFDISEAEGAHFITMEYVGGEDLKTMIRMSGMLGMGTALSVGKQICEGLAEAHSQGIVHRDLKPTNIMIDKEGNARIMDFGIARSLKGKGITGAGVMIGTPEYMSPEQVEGKEADQRSDIYSLGIILYEMLTGRVPFEGDTPFSIAMKHKTEAPQDPRSFNAQVPSALSHVILKCMEKDRARRYQSAEDVVSELDKTDKGKTGAIKVDEWKNSIAVLSFKNMSADPEQEYFCEGIAEELLNALTQIKELRVAARTSAFSFKGKDVDIREIGRTLNVDKVLEGSVRKSGQRLRITAQLVNVEDGYHIWSDQFDREIKDIFAIQEEISLIIVDKLKLKLLKEEKEKIFKRHTDDHEAYNLYLKGRYFWYRRHEGGLQKGLEFFQQAIARDPLYALAYVGIADSFGSLGLFSFIPPKEAYPRAKAAVKKALEIDPELGEAYASLGWISMLYDWDWQAAEKQYLHAIKLNPYFAPAHIRYGMCLAITGRFDESIGETKKAEELDPLEPFASAFVGWSLYMARRFDEAIEQNRKVIAMDPNYSIVYWYQAQSCTGRKLWDEAIASGQKHVQLSGGAAFALATLGLVYGLAGMRDEALNALERMIALSKERYVSPFQLAWFYVGLGEKDQALENFEKAYTDRDSMMPYLGTFPLFDSVRSEPRFQALLKKMNLE